MGHAEVMIYRYLVTSLSMQFRLEPSALLAADDLRGSTLSAPSGQIPVP